MHAFDSNIPLTLNTHTHPHFTFLSLALFLIISFHFHTPPLVFLHVTSPLLHSSPSLLTQSLPAALFLLLTSLGNLLPAVIPVLLGDSQAGSCQPLFGRELPDVPELDGLVLRVADQIACIALAQS